MFIADLTLTLHHNVHCALRDAAHAFYQGVVYFRNVTRLHGTAVHVRLYRETICKNPPALNTFTWKDLVLILTPIGTINAESTSKILCAPLNNVRGTPRWYLQNSEPLKNFCGRPPYLTLPNRAKDVKTIKILKICIYARGYRTPCTAPISTTLTISERLSSKVFYNEFNLLKPSGFFTYHQV
jgi:hypothetical protein